jgi:hypothetical protein
MSQEFDANKEIQRGSSYIEEELDKKSDEMDD